MRGRGDNTIRRESTPSHAHRAYITFAARQIYHCVSNITPPSGGISLQKSLDIRRGLFAYPTQTPLALKVYGLPPMVTVLPATM